MSVTMDEMNAKIEASGAQTDVKIERAVNSVREELLRQRIWFLITAIFIVASTVSILSYLDNGREASAPVIINLPMDASSPLK